MPELNSRVFTGEKIELGTVQDTARAKSEAVRGAVRAELGEHQNAAEARNFPEGTE